MSKAYSFVCLALLLAPGVIAEVPSRWVLPTIENEQLRGFYETANRICDLSIVGSLPSVEPRSDELSFESASEQNQNSARMCYTACTEVFGKCYAKSAEWYAETPVMRALEVLDARKRAYDFCWSHCDSILLEEEQ